MKQKAFVVDFILTAFVLGALFGVLDVYLAKHGVAPISQLDRWLITLGFSTAFATIRQQARGSRKVATASDAARSEALALAPVADRAVLYVLRDVAFARRLGFDIEIDGAVRAQTRGKTFVRLLLEPGKHRIASRHIADGARVEYTFDCAAGQVILLEQWLAWGWLRPKQELRPLEPAAAALRMARCRMIEPLGDVAMKVAA